MISARPPNAPTGKPAADDFAQRGQIGHDSVNFLRAAARDAKTGHHFIEDQERAVLRAFVAQRLEKTWLRKIKAGVGRNRFENDGGDLVRVLAKRRAHRVDVVERKRDRQVGEILAARRRCPG